MKTKQYMYVVRDNRFFRRDGKSQYIAKDAPAGAGCYVLTQAAHWSTKAQAKKAVHYWANACEYTRQMAETWVEIIRVNEYEIFGGIR